MRSSRGSSRPRRTQASSCNAGGFFTSRAAREALSLSGETKSFLPSPPPRQSRCGLRTPRYPSPLGLVPLTAERFEVRTVAPHGSPGQPGLLPSCPPPSAPLPRYLTQIQFSQDIRIAGSQSLGFSSHYLPKLEIPQNRVDFFLFFLFSSLASTCTF